MALSTELASEIAKLFNSIAVADPFIRDALDGGKVEDYDLWHQYRMEAVARLREIGINPIGFEHFVGVSE